MTGSTNATSSQPDRPTTTASPRCAACSSHIAIYTCPRCATRTCSLACSAAHKTRTACSGVREKAKFVPMNRYTHGTMMDDYVFLEDVGRKVSEWGRDIARGGYATLPHRPGPGPGPGPRPRGAGGRARREEGASGKKRDVLRSQLESRDIEMDSLPAGMERRTLNRSTWDPKKRTAFLTVQYDIHPPPALDAGQNEPPRGPYTLLTHRNDFDLSLRDLFQSQISQRTKGKARADPPAWVKTLALPDPDVPDAFAPPEFYIRAPLDPSSGRSEKFGFFKLDCERKLGALLKNKQFVEFPTIEVWEEGAFRGVLFDAAGAFESHGGQRPAKRRRLDATKGRAAIAGLLGGYGSDASDEADTALSRLEEYEGSGAEAERLTTSEDDRTEDDDDDEGEADAVADPVTLLAMVQEAQRRLEEKGEYEEVDWGESDMDS
ncbi:hypothetical protein F5148DRAFT_61586 [Russula earlei]|uniref:Uncharacterized protein n=1 Tax=Russula earlei TaxID=71964 RepID=A0ACC0UKS6_9AGAM|nr:hypothetical protein F5148DRAFT_61586 [Russula earlei]